MPRLPRPPALLSGSVLCGRLGAFCVLTAGLGMPLRAESFTLRNARAVAVVDTVTLECRWQPAGRRMVELSAARTSAGAGTAEEADAVEEPVELRREDSRLEWRLPGEGIRVEVLLEAETLTWRFQSPDPGSFTWPTVADPAIQAWTLPMHEGAFVPAGDSGWIRHLTEAGALDTTADLGLPFWGLRYEDMTVSAILTNPFNNQIRFENRGGRLGMSLSHEFTSTQRQREYGLRFQAGGLSPVEAARHYRAWLKAQGKFVSMEEKTRHTPQAAKLAGAPHIYLWGQGPLAAADGRDWPRVLRLLFPDPPVPAPAPAADSVSGSGSVKEAGKEEGENSPERASRADCVRLLSPEIRKLAARATVAAGTREAEPLSRYDQSLLAGEFNRLLRHPDFAESADCRKLALPPEAASLLEKSGGTLSDRERLARNTAVLQALFPDCFAPAEDWGDGVCPRMMRDLAEAGFDRLWLGSDSWQGMRERPETVSAAEKLGFLTGPYDSYHSMHPPGLADTWETAQLGAEIYASGGILKADGQARKGFQQKGKLLSPLAARPLVEERVGRLLGEFPANSWFVDCDGFGQFFDDYTPSRSASQADDAAARHSRLEWIRDQGREGGLVIGSEGCSAVMADVLHFAHGVMTPTLGWGDPDMRDKSSRYFLGAYYPPNGPAVFFKPIPLKEEYHLRHFDPRFRLPLFQTVFHDSVVATHHWGSGSLKFRDETVTNSLLELLYGVPPLWHLNREEFARNKARLLRHHAVFSPFHREIWALPLSDFEWMNAERSVQRTQFGDGAARVTANFSAAPFALEGRSRPLEPRQILLELRGREEVVYSP